MQNEVKIDELVKGILEYDKRILSRSITFVENETEGRDLLLKKI